MQRLAKPSRWVIVLVVVAVGAWGLTGCVADPPPMIGIATASDGQAVVSWQAPVSAPAPITAYVVTPWIGLARQTPVVFNSTATTQTVAGLTNGVTYTFTVHGFNGSDTAESDMSNPVSPGPRLVSGDDHACVLVAGGAVKCWGANGTGQLGNGTTVNSSTAVAVSGITGATDIAAGRYHTCAVVAGTVQCWGYNNDGELGNGTTTTSSTPVAVSGITTAISVSASDRGTCALLAPAGTVQCWGWNGATGIAPAQVTPVAIDGVTGATAIGVGNNHACALVAGTVKCWGSDQVLQLGDIYDAIGTNPPYPLMVPPLTATGITPAVGITAGSYYSCAVLAGGTAQCWGENLRGQVGNNAEHNWEPPTAVYGMTTATAINAGQYHTCAVLAGGTAQCWGDDDSGQVGDGQPAQCQICPVPTCQQCQAPMDVLVPTTVLGVSPQQTLTSVIALSPGDSHTCAMRTDRTVLCWGDNQYGQLGRGFVTGSFSRPLGPVLGL